MNIVLDPNIYILNRNYVGDECKEQEHYFFMDRVFSLIDQHLSLSIACTDLFLKQIIRANDHPWNQYRLFKTHAAANIYKIVMRNLDWGNLVLIENEDIAELDFTFIAPYEVDSLYAFLKYISYAYKKSLEILIFFGICHHTVNRPVRFYVGEQVFEHIPVFDPYYDNHDLLRELLLRKKI